MMNMENQFREVMRILVLMKRRDSLRRVKNNQNIVNEQKNHISNIFKIKYF